MQHQDKMINDYKLWVHELKHTWPRPRRSKEGKKDTTRKEARREVSTQKARSYFIWSHSTSV